MIGRAQTIITPQCPVSFSPGGVCVSRLSAFVVLFVGELESALPSILLLSSLSRLHGLVMGPVK